MTDADATAGVPRASGAPDVATVTLPVGGRAMILSDLRLTSAATTSSTAAVGTVAQAMDAWTGPGAVIFAGNLLDQLTDERTTVDAALGAHPRLAEALARFASAAGRQVVVVPGLRDASMAWDERTQQALVRRGMQAALAVDLVVDTGAGDRRVRVEAGDRHHAPSARRDPRSPDETPLAQHLITEVVPGFGGAGRTWLAGAARLRRSASLPQFIASRFLYRRVLRLAWVLLLPLLVAALAVKLPLAALTARFPGNPGTWTRGLVLVGAATVVDAVLIGLVLAVLIRRGWAAMSGDDGVGPSVANDAARHASRALVADGLAGLVTGHTCEPELTPMGAGFYANAGCATELIDERPGRLGLPSVFVPARIVSWVEIEAGADLHARLLVGRLDLPGATVIERLVAAAPDLPVGRAQPEVVAAFPGAGTAWPPRADPALRLTRVRRRAAAAIGVAGLADLVSAITPPLRGRLASVLELVPLAVPQTATALVALAGIALLLLARGVRKGQRRAWLVAVALLAGTAVLHLLKGFDLEDSAVAIAVAAYLLVNRDVFRAATDEPRARRGAVALVAGVAGLAVGGVLTVEVITALGSGRLAVGDAAVAVASRLIGLRVGDLPRRLDQFASPTLVAATVGLVSYSLFQVFRPVAHRRDPAVDTGHAKAREIVTRHGRGTLDWFALRDDKQFFFSGSGLVAYGVWNGVCLVSPDPIGPAAERDVLWDGFRHFADAQGWALAVLGAGEEWLPVYRRSGMHDLYVGDEAVVDVRTFSLDGGRHKSLRQAVNRIAKYGYTMSFHDPLEVSEELREQVRAVLTKSRRGDVERGFSMTLGRIFDPTDTDLLLAVCHGPDGRAVAFCQYVPAPGINGYSLDLMRRDDGDHPNGLLDFVVVETVRRIQAEGKERLGLNFATMRAVLAGETGPGLVPRIERWVLQRMSGSMQIESLWRFNAKFDPEWLPRYAVYDVPEHLLPAALAIARAESFWELPVIGRFFTPDTVGAGSSAG